MGMPFYQHRGPCRYVYLVRHYTEVNVPTPLLKDSPLNAPIVGEFNNLWEARLSTNSLAGKSMKENAIGHRRSGRCVVQLYHRTFTVPQWSTIVEFKLPLYEEPVRPWRSWAPAHRKEIFLVQQTCSLEGHEHDLASPADDDVFEGDPLDPDIGWW